MKEKSKQEREERRKMLVKGGNSLELRNGENEGGKKEENLRKIKGKRRI